MSNPCTSTFPLPSLVSRSCHHSPRVTSTLLSHGRWQRSITCRVRQAQGGRVSHSGSTSQRLQASVCQSSSTPLPGWVNAPKCIIGPYSPRLVPRSICFNHLPPCHSLCLFISLPVTLSVSSSSVPLPLTTALVPGHAGSGCAAGDGSCHVELYHTPQVLPQPRAA